MMSVGLRLSVYHFDGIHRVWMDLNSFMNVRTVPPLLKNSSSTHHTPSGASPNTITANLSRLPGSHPTTRRR
jgi:hypothetical protein